MAEGGGLEPPSPKAPVFKTGGLPIILTLRRGVSLPFLRARRQVAAALFLREGGIGGDLRRWPNFIARRVEVIFVAEAIGARAQAALCF